MHVTPLEHIILIPSQPIFALSPNAACLAERQQISILVFGLTRSGLKPQSTALEASTLTITPSMRSKILQHLFLNKQPRIFASQTRDITELLIINYPKEQILGGTNLCS